MQKPGLSSAQNDGKPENRPFAMCVHRGQLSWSLYLVPLGAQVKGATRGAEEDSVGVEPEGRKAATSSTTIQRKVSPAAA